jgi:hypothetical protein
MPTSTRNVLAGTVFVAVTLLMTSRSTLTQSAGGAEKQSAPAAKQAQTMGGMMADRKGMMADFAAADKKLDELVARMNAATGTAKVDAIAAVINELVTERTQMRNRMTTMQDRMMEHMMSMQSADHAGHQPGQK